MRFDRYLVLRNPESTDAKKAATRIRGLQAIAAQQDIIMINTVPGGWEANARMLQPYRDLLGERTLLCIAGGDGTVNLALNILLGDPGLSDKARRTPILPLWAGNANDLAYMLNGSPLRTSLRTILRKGTAAAIHPLVCTLDPPDGIRTVAIASNYASFGASAFATQKMVRSLHSRSPMRQFAVSRFGLEFVEVTILLMRAPKFRMREDGNVVEVYERTFLKGSRFAKTAVVPLRLTENRYHRTTVGRKRLWPLLWPVLFRLSEFLRGRTGRADEATHDNFTVLDDVWAQFDGESVRVQAGTQVSVALSERPFYALSTRLKSHDRIDKHWRDVHS